MTTTLDTAQQRQDLASRSSPKRHVTGKTRLRTRQACEPCRKRKRKCDGFDPCDQCVGFEYECQYSSNSGDPVAHPPRRDPSDSLDTRRGSKSQKVESSGYSRSEVQPESMTPLFTRRSRPFSPSANPGVKAGQSVVEPSKGRFSYAHSGVVLPRKLGQEMELRDDLKFHSYGWNLSTRPEPRSFVAPTLHSILTFQSLSFYSQLFFDVVDPVYHFVDRARYNDRCAAYWLAEKVELDDIEALISGVVALGSFFAPEPFPGESQLIEHAKQILDIGSAYAPARLSMDQAAAWVLRALYLRLTTRPHLSWYASCAAMHVVEAMGMHVDLQAVDLAGRDSTALTTEYVSSRRCIFDCAIFLNAIISAEYGRSRVQLPGLDNPTESNIDAGSNTALRSLTKLMLLIEADSAPGRIRDVLSSIRDLPSEPPIFVLLKADIAIHLYRKHLNAKHLRPSTLEIQAMLSIIKAALSAARDLLSNKQPWWNLLSTPFQSTLILMAIDTGESLDLVCECMSVLTAIYDTFRTHSAIEVVQTARVLVEGLERRKLREAGSLRRAADLTNALRDATTVDQRPHMANQAQNFLEDWIGGEIDWNFMFEGDAAADFSLGQMPNFP